TRLRATHAGARLESVWPSDHPVVVLDFRRSLFLLGPGRRSRRASAVAADDSQRPPRAPGTRTGLSVFAARSSSLLSRWRDHHGRIRRRRGQRIGRRRHRPVVVPGGGCRRICRCWRFGGGTSASYGHAAAAGPVLRRPSPRPRGPAVRLAVSAAGLAAATMSIAGAASIVAAVGLY